MFNNKSSFIKKIATTSLATIGLCISAFAQTAPDVNAITQKAGTAINSATKSVGTNLVNPIFGFLFVIGLIALGVTMKFSPDSSKKAFYFMGAFLIVWGTVAAVIAGL
jgi:Ca2+/Na+ antiporter